MSATAAHTETVFEAAIEQRLIATGGYQKRKAARYDEALVLFP